MDHVPGLDLPAAHRALLQRAVDHSRDDKRVMGLVLGGSLAHGVADSYSDVDLYIVARDESLDAVFEETGAVALALGSPLLSFAKDPIPEAAGTTSLRTLQSTKGFGLRFRARLSKGITPRLELTRT